MAYLRKNVNVFLLLLLLAVVIGLVGISAYYQITYKELSGQYTEKTDSLNQLSSQLTSKSQELNLTKTSLKVQEEDLGQFEQLYLDLKDDNEKIELDNTQLREELTSTIKGLQQANVDIIVLENTIEDKDQDIEDFQESAADFKSERNDARDDVCALQVQFSVAPESYC